MELPKNAIRLRTAEHMHIRPNRPGGRILDPNTGHQIEVAVTEVEFICPICNHPQLAPPLNNVEYECPKCKYRYKVEDEVLAMWNPGTVGVTTEALQPGEFLSTETTEKGTILDSPVDPEDPEKVEHEMDKSLDKFAKADYQDNFAKKVQVVKAKPSFPRKKK